MPLQETSGAASYDAFGGGVPVVPAYIEEVFSTYLYTGNGTSQVIENGINLGTSNSGGSVYFNGNTDYIATPSSGQFTASGDFTVSCWFYLQSFSNAYYVVGGNWNAGASDEWLIQVQNNGAIRFLTSAGTSFSSAGVVSLNQWIYFTATRSGTTVTVKLNGTTVSTYTKSDTLGSATKTIYIGQQSANNWPWNGYISNFRLVSGSAITTVPTDQSTAVSGTSLLTCQSPAYFIDKSSNAFTLTTSGNVVGKSFGPFTSSTAGKGGLVWQKDRSQGTGYHHILQDTARGATNCLFTNLTNAQSQDSAGTGFVFNNNGFTIGSTNVKVNASGDNYASWTFRKQPKFFDVVTYTGNGTAGRTVAHSLGSVPGCMIVRPTSAVDDWFVYHRSLLNSQSLFLNLTTAASNTPSAWNSTTPTSTEFTVGTNTATNANGVSYVAYLFAHNAGGFGLTGTDNVISCGSFTTDGSGNATVSLGYEPQWVLVKRTNTTEAWQVIDNMRAWPVTPAAGNYAKKLLPNSSAAEADTGEFPLTNTGFSASGIGASNTYIYIAIRRGPMKVPTSGTSVFTPLSYTNSTGGVTISSLTYPADLVITDRKDTSSHRAVWDRLRGATKAVYTNLTNAEGTAGDGLSSFASNVGYTTGSGGVADNTVDGSQINWVFKRAPSFFDEVCYTGTGSLRTVSHNLGAVPELLIVKRRDTAEDWNVYSAATGNAAYLRLNTTAAVGTAGADALWGSTTPTSSVFTVKTSGGTNASGGTFVAYLFATCAGVSKVGSYTGTGTTKQIDCGFTGGARFVLIKKTSGTGSWYVWDSARGIVSGNDPYLLLNSTAAEVTNTDYIDTYSAGFEISSTAPSEINENGGSFIFFAVA